MIELVVIKHLSKMLVCLVLLILTFLVGIRSPARAQMATPDLDVTRMKSDADYFLSNGADIFLLWLYSGKRVSPFGNDQHSFFAETPVGERVCQEVLLPSGGRVGVNMHEIGPYPDSQIQEAFDWLQGCGVTYLRTYLSGGGGAEEAQRILNIASDYNLKVILALANPVLGTHMPNYQELASDNYEWYNSGYQTGYRAHAESVVSALRNHPALYGVELANEPHCAAETSALPKYQNWVDNMSSLLRSYGVQVGIGQMASSAASACDSPVIGSTTPFYSTNQPGSITMTSAHYYETRTLAITAMSEASSLGKSFYIGEAGFGEGGDPSTPSNPYTPPNDPFPDPFIPCDQVFDDQDFHSLRPFQVSACNRNITEVNFAMCANDLIATERLEIAYGTVPPGMSIRECQEVDGNQVCVYEFQDRRVDVNVDLTNAELPIAGLTEGPYVNNSLYRPFGDFTDSQRVNEYVSWYMNGTIHRAEGNRPVYYEGYPGQPEGMSDEDFRKLLSEAREVVNFSGPLKKLLPFRIQQDERVEEIYKATGEEDTAIERHNQIAGCLYNVEGYDLLFGFVAAGGDILNFFNSLGPIDILIPDEAFTGRRSAEHPPGPCYPALDKNGNGEITSDEMDQLKVDLGFLPDWLTPDLRVRVERKRLSDWIGNLPPKREDYASYSDYWQDYKRWRGDFCLDLGFFYICYDEPGSDILRPNWLGELFPYVPFSSTEDRVGEIYMETGGTQPTSDLQGGNVVFEPDNNDNSKNLYFPHMQETTELGTLLQRTYVPGGDEQIKSKWLVEANFIPEDSQGSYNSNFCEPVESRSPNPGDDLFGEYESEGDQVLSGDIVYSGNFTCTFPRQVSTGGGTTDLSCEGFGAGEAHCNTTQCQQYTCGSDGFWIGPQGTGVCSTHPDCTGGVTEPPQIVSYGNCTVELSTGLSLFTKVPKIEEMWERYVDGEMSVFKRIYPKVGAGAPVDEILDIPADTQVSYFSSATETQAGNPDRNRPGTNAKLYIPHLGSVYDYFLKGIQKALRPKSAGTIVSTIGQSLSPAFNPYDSIACPTTETPPSNISFRSGILCESTPRECAPNAVIPNAYSGAFKQNVIDLAQRWVAEGGENSLVEYCYNTVVNQSLAAGVNPVYTLAIWIQESGASNYDSNVTTCDPDNPSNTVQDFGINDTSIAGNFAAQLNRFLRLPYYYPNNYEQCFEDGCNLGTFSRVYQQGATGDCSVNSSAINYAAKTLNTMSLINPTCQPVYPTDLSCSP